MARLVHLVVLPERVHQECLHHILLVHLARVDGVHQVGVVQHHFRRLLGERLALGVDDVDQSGVSQILDVVHHGGAARLYVYGQLTHIGCLGAIDGQFVEQALDFGEVFQLYLLDEQYVNLGHHVHRLQEVFGVVATLLEKRVETMV